MIELEEIYQSMIKIFQRYLDMDARYYKIVALWTIGTHFHKIFQTFPYLYLNATRGSGKTRLLKLISYFSRNGSVIGLPSEAFIFREAEAMTFCFDEMDNIQQKEKNDLRLLLNTAYKKGLFVPRMKKNKEGQIETEKFETFAPVAIANIWGLESVLQDRCVSMILEKSHNAQITKKVEAWELEKDCIKLKERLQSINTATYEISFFGITRLEDMAYIPVVWNAVLENLKEEKDFN
ncbi:MAG TPA: hypothetical protein VJ343_02710, partial [archaeon]|nr:hypothetical protein [archaeon]